MLKNIPKIISPDLMKYMMEMGHADKLILADANYPGTSHAKRLIRMDSVEIPDLLEAILQFFPLDTFVEDCVYLMKNLPTEPVPDVWKNYETIIREQDFANGFQEFSFTDRLPFYEMSEEAYVVVQTGTTLRYANIVLQKGVI